MFDPFRRKTKAPTQNTDGVDLVGKRDDGGVDLFIVVSSRLSGSPDHQQLLLDKIQSYLDQINTPSFQAEFKSPSANKTRIIVACTEEPDPDIRELIRRSEAWMAENNARLVYKITS